jgi:hypothetical protein
VHAHIQRLVFSVVKMTTGLKKYTTVQQCSVVHFLWAKRLIAKDIHKEMFPVYGGVCHTKQFTTEWQTFC